MALSSAVVCCKGSGLGFILALMHLLVFLPFFLADCLNSWTVGQWAREEDHAIVIRSPSVFAGLKLSLFGFIKIPWHIQSAFLLERETCELGGLSFGGSDRVEFPEAAGWIQSLVGSCFAEAAGLNLSLVAGSPALRKRPMPSTAAEV